MKYVKKIIYWIGFVITAVALYYLFSRYQQRTISRANRDIADIHKSNKRIKDYLDTARSNAREITSGIEEAGKANKSALDVVSKLEKTNERFRKLLLDIQKNSDN